MDGDRPERRAERRSRVCVSAPAKRAVGVFDHRRDRAARLAVSSCSSSFWLPFLTPWTASSLSWSSASVVCLPIAGEDPDGEGPVASSSVVFVIRPDSCGSPIESGAVPRGEERSEEASAIGDEASARTGVAPVGGAVGAPRCGVLPERSPTGNGGAVRRRRLWGFFFASGDTDVVPEG